jgi:DNA-binding NtrC family response regulator
VERKEFRQDLFFRLNVVPVFVPPLRERREDIPFLAQQFLQRFTRKHGVHVSGISSDCMGTLVSHQWLGNVRELQNAIERAVILCGDGDELMPDHLGFNAPSHADHSASVSVSQPVSLSPVAAAPAPTAAAPTVILPLADVEKQHILQALEHYEGNRTQAAKQLGISIRTLRNKLHEYGVALKASESEEE